MAQRLKTTHAGNRDYITPLPDNILAEILSELPLKEAVRTCVLSKDWKTKWTLLTDVTFHDEFFYADDAHDFDGASFLNIAETTLGKMQDVLSFSLFCCREEYDPRQIASCIETAFRGNAIQELVVSNELDEPVLLPGCVLNCISLRKLVLKNFRTKIPTIDALPDLKTLSLSRVMFLNEHSRTKTVSLSFPNLESCNLDQCSWHNIKMLNICAPKLIGLYCGTKRDEDPEDDDDDEDCTISISGATKLEHCSVYGGYPANIHLNGATVQHATVDCQPVQYYDDTLILCGIQLRKLLRQFSSLKVLTVSGDTAAAIGNSNKEELQALSDPDYQYIPGPVFEELEKLEIFPPIHREGLLDILKWTPNLKFLNVNSLDLRCYGWSVSFKQLQPPYCIVSSLEEVQFVFYNGNEHQNDLIDYLMKNGTVLKRIRIGWYDRQNEHLKEQMKTFSTASSSVEIVIGEN